MANKRISNIIIGLVFIFIGSVIFLENLGWIDMEYGFLSWPIALLLPALGFHLGFFLSGMKKEYAGLLVPGGILLVLSLYFYLDIITDYQYSEFTWPTILLAPAFGLFLLWYFGEREKGLFIPIGILTILALLFYAQSFLQVIIQLWPLVLVFVGIFILFHKGRKNNKAN
ncbi:LiaI-LiaF-like domain-containing protein [Pontibacillus salicampi]|uniref:LiaI-LiaF-like domain-containing protein n=1 Tax=Pontibacillus salicampi TaxID=1449801 RepID=A0ABV6LQ76_9BACI